MMVRSSFAMVVFAGIGAPIVAFTTLLGIQATAQEQTTPTENHHPNSSSNQQFGINSTAEQLQNTTTVGVGMIRNNQTFTTSWMSLVNGVKLTDISVIDNEHIAINLQYDGEGELPGVSVVAITNNSSFTILESMIMQNSTILTSNSTMPTSSMQSGSNYLEAGWLGRESNSAILLVQLDGDIPQGGRHITVIIFPFLHR